MHLILLIVAITVLSFSVWTEIIVDDFMTKKRKKYPKAVLWAEKIMGSWILLISFWIMVEIYNISEDMYYFFHS